MGGSWLRMRKLYQEEGGKYPDPILKMTWPYADPESPTPEEIAMEFNGQGARPTSPIPKDQTKVTRKAGEQLAGFAQLRDDGSTASGCWIFCGAVDPGRQPDGPARQLRSDRHRPDAELGVGVAGEPARAVQPRLVRRERQAVRSRSAS